MNKKIFVGVIIVVILGISIFCFSRKSEEKKVEAPVVSQNTDAIINAVTFDCAKDKSIQAIFFKDKVELNLSDKRSMLLLQSISASGARYANSDESFVFWNKGNTAFVTEGKETTFLDCVETVPTSPKDQVSTGIANPASVNCLKVGGSLKIEERGDGGQYGLCYFEDNRACEEWSLMRGECPVGGVKTTGFDTIDQKYCAWAGGQTKAVPNAICIFKNGSKCSTLDFFNGKCLLSY